MAGLLTFGAGGVAIASYDAYKPSPTPANFYRTFAGVDFYGEIDGLGDWVKGDPYLLLNRDAKDEDFVASQELANTLVGEMESLDSYFDANMMHAIWNALDTEATECELSELDAFVPEDPTSGPVNLKVQFPSNYKIGAKVAVLIGVQTEDGMQWFVAMGQVTDEGTVQCHLSGEVLEACKGNSAVIGIVNSTSDYAE